MRWTLQPVGIRVCRSTVPKLRGGSFVAAGLRDCHGLIFSTSGEGPLGLAMDLMRRRPVVIKKIRKMPAHALHRTADSEVGALGEGNFGLVLLLRNKELQDQCFDKRTALLRF